MANPHSFGPLLVPGRPRAGAVDFQRQPVLAPGRDLADRERPAPVAQVKQLGSEVVGVDEHARRTSAAFRDAPAKFSGSPTLRVL